MSGAAVVKAPGKGLRIALAVSVALNLAVAGLFAGSFLKDHEEGGPRGVREIGFGPFSEALSRDDRKALRRALLARMPEMRQARQEAGRDAQVLLGVLRADPFDPGQLTAVLEAQRVRMAGRFEVGQGLMRDLLVAMTPEARQAFADRLEKRLQHGGKDGLDKFGDEGLPPKP
ncbi:periplasmic heavy metal sensor [Cypionkella psychrotolerans]|uniref:periplasmic heavy metal sensor n=1 Tax=Cypionkella psychrotolerans TaxID=1678131 RepID=UPI0006B41230|nr:periplasmic heavy metal sensor [Cypionkella psychrotolerans]